MEKQTILRTLALCGLAGFALAVPAMPKDIALNGGVDVRTDVSAVRVAPATDPLPGLHFEARINGRTMDVYVAPMDFATKYDIKVKKGEEVHIVGTEAKSGDADVVLAREITTGAVDPKTGKYHDNMTIYLRNDAGPLW